MRSRAVTEVVGWYGFAAILGAYATSNLGMLAMGSLEYRLLNLTGAVALIVDAWPDRNWQIITLNLVWACIAIISMTRV